jgi:hypothetical protein
MLEIFHAKFLQSMAQPSHISLKVGELEDSIENGTLSKFQHPVSCSFSGTAV